MSMEVPDIKIERNWSTALEKYYSKVQAINVMNPTMNNDFVWEIVK